MLLFLVVMLALFSGLIVLFFTLGVGKILSRVDRNADTFNMLHGLSESEIAIKANDAHLPDKKSWTGYWYYDAVRAGYSPENPASPSYVALGLAFIAFALGTFVWPQDVLGGLIFAFGGPILLKFIFNSKAKARTLLIEKQLPMLLAGLRSNLNAKVHVQVAILNVGNELPDPIGEELRKVATELELGIPLTRALRNFSARIDSKEIGFLVSAINTVLETGAELEGIIETIEDIVVQRQRIANHLRSAVAKVQPAIGVTGVMIPLAFFYSFFSSPENREFWTSFPIGIIAMVLVGVFYAIGLAVARWQVQRVKNS